MASAPLLPVFVDSPLNVRPETPYYDWHTDLPHGSKAWKAVYNKRVSVERAFSRLKGQQRLDDLKHRGLVKAGLHVALSVMAHLAASSQ